MLNQSCFVQMPVNIYQREHATFYLWNEQTGETRFMFSFDSTQKKLTISLNN